ncbi:WD40-repeat-containing domain protein [Lanmaoa asiatica]|nr:WD40-repeat-containing domain protein [Lanmaoa asiatica]
METSRFSHLNHDALLFATRMYFFVHHEGDWGPVVEKKTPNNDADDHDPETPKDSAIQSGMTQDRHDGEWSQNDSDVLCRIENRGGPISSLVFLAGGRRIASSCHGDNKIRLWNVENDRLEEIEPPMEHPGASVNTIATSQGGTWIVSGDDNGKVVIWDTATQLSQKVGEFVAAEGHGGKITALDISPVSLRVVSGSENGTVVIWCMEKKRTSDWPTETPRLVTGHRISGQDSSSIQIWHSRTGVQLESISNTQATYSLAWSTDGHRLFAGGPNGSVKYFNVLTRTPFPEWEAPSADLITSLCVSNTGHFLVSVSSGRAKGIDIWDTRTLPSKHIRSCREVLIAAISPDATLLVSGGKDNYITVRNLSIAVDRSYLFHHLSPSPGQSEPLTYIDNAAYEAWKGGNLSASEKILSTKIKDNHYRDLIQYARANRALVRARRKNWPGALEDANAITVTWSPYMVLWTTQVCVQSNNDQAPLIAYIAKGIALRGQGDNEGAMRAFTTGNSDRNTTHFVECVKVRCTFQRSHSVIKLSTSVVHHFSRLLSINRQNTQARRCFLLADHHKSGQDHSEVLKPLEAVPDLRPLLHVPDVNTILLMLDWDLRGLIYGIHKLRCRALFESGRMPGVINYFSTKEASPSEDLESIKAKLSSLSGEGLDPR